jgi:hypothetical protein
LVQKPLKTPSKKRHRKRRENELKNDPKREPTSIPKPTDFQFVREMVIFRKTHPMAGRARFSWFRGTKIDEQSIPKSIKKTFKIMLKKVMQQSRKSSKHDSKLGHKSMKTL